MKLTGQIELAFETDLMFCFRYDLEDGEFQVSFRKLLTLSLVVGVHSLLFLASQILKKHSTEHLLNFLILFLIGLLLKPSLLWQHKTNLQQYPLAPTSTAKSSTDHPLNSIVVSKAKYLLILVLYHDTMFSSQGHVNSMSVTFLKALENVVILGLIWVKAMWIRKLQFPSRSTRRTQSGAWCKMPTGGVLLRGTLVLFFTNLVHNLGEISTAYFVFKMKLLRHSMILCKTVSCLNVYLPCCSDTLQAHKMCAVVHTFLLHKVHMPSVVILHPLEISE